MMNADMKTDHVAALKDAKRMVQQGTFYYNYERNVAAAYLELRGLAKAHIKRPMHITLEALRAVIGEE